MQYDLVIIGAGPAGLTAAMFARRNGVNVLVLNSLEQLSNLALSHLVENHPGEKGIPGIELLEKMREQVIAIGVEIKDEKTISIKKDKHFIVKTEENEYECCSVILATGLVSRKANIPGEEKYLGHGVSYCVLCDGPLFKGKNVVVIGGGDSAVSGAVQLKEMGVKKVYLIHRRDEFRAEDANMDKMKGKVDAILNSVVEQIAGERFVESVRIKNTKTGETKMLAVDAVFIEIGYVPTAELAKNLGVKLDENGFVTVDENRETNIPGVFAAGDVTSKPLKILVAAYSDGAIAGLNAAQYACDIRGKKFERHLY